MDFITGAEIAEKIRYVCAGENVRVACAFWGRSIAADLFPSPRTDALVVFNHMLGGTTHAAASHLRDTLGDRVRAHPTLHAKVFASARGAVIGSANASMNGFGGFYEAGVWVAPDEDGYQTALGYAETLLDDSIIVDSNVLENCRQSFCAARAGTLTVDLGEVQAQTFSEAISNYAEAFEMPFVLTDDDGDIEHARRAYERHHPEGLPDIWPDSIEYFDWVLPEYIQNAPFFVSLHTNDSGRTVRVSVQRFLFPAPEHSFCRLVNFRFPGVLPLEGRNRIRGLGRNHGLAALFTAPELDGDSMAEETRPIFASDLAAILQRQ